MNGVEKMRLELESAAIIQKGNYNYFLWSVTEQHPPLHHDVIADCSMALLKKMNHEKADLVVTAEAMGITIATVISQALKVPMIIGTQRQKGVPGEYEAWYQTGYKMDRLNFSPIPEGSNVLIVDDVISTGGTAIAMINAVRQFKSNVLDIGVLLNKINYPGLKRMRDAGFEPKRLFDITVGRDKVVIENSYP